jgi:hypothetical protein
MKNYFKLITLAALALASAVPVGRAQESIAGKWKGEFDSQIGLQKYTYTFRFDGTNVTGAAHSEKEMGTNDVAISEIKIAKDEISFIEPMKFQDNEIRIEYTGEIKGDEIKFHRKVGDFAEEDFVAKRVTETGAKSGTPPESGSGTNSPPAMP